MAYSFLIYSILIIISIVTLLTLCFSAISAIHIIASTSKSINLFKFYVFNMYYSILCAIIYVSFFILFLYGLRIWNVNHTFDLHIIYFCILSFSKLPAVVYITILIFGLFLSVNLFLYLALLHKYCLHQIYIIYFYFRYMENNSNSISWFFYKICWPSNQDILAYSIHTLLYKINAYFLKNRKFNFLHWTDSRAKIPWYFLFYHLDKFLGKITYNKYYETFVTFSPLFFIFYDCIFNNFIITNLYRYLLLYIPIIIWRRITKCLATEAIYVCELLHNIYYKKETCIYAMRAAHKIVFDSYILSGLRSNVDLDLDIEIYLKSASCFEPDTDERDVYCNIEGALLTRTYDNKLFQKIMDEEVFLEEWIFLVDKHHFVTNNKHKILVFIT